MENFALENLTLVIGRRQNKWYWKLRDTLQHDISIIWADDAMSLFKTVPYPLSHTAAFLIEKLQPGTFINERKP